MSNERSTLILGHSPGSQTSQLLNVIGELRPNWKVVAVVNSANQFADELDRYNPDFCILDLGDGQDSSALLGPHDAWSSGPTLVLSKTASDAMVAYDLGATDFVTTKPLKKDRLAAALERLENAQDARASARSGGAAGDENTGKWAKFLKVIDGSRLLVVPVEEVRYLQADQKYTRVFLGNRTGIVRHSLGKVYEHLNRDQFWQMHRSTVINANYIREVERDDLGRLKVKVADYSHALQVAKPKERLFRDSIFV